jgi:hypothetical protein
MAAYKPRKPGDIRGGQSKYITGEGIGGGIGVRVGKDSSLKGVKKKDKTLQERKDEFYLKKRKENPAAGPTHMKPSATKKVKKKVKKEVKKEDSPPTPVSKDMSFKQKAVYGTGVVVATGLGMVATEKAQDANKGKPKSDFITMMRTAIDSSKRDAVKTTGIKRPKLKAFKEARVIKAPSPAKSLVPGVKADSGDGPGPTPKSAMRESQIRDFKKYNKSNLLGRSIDDALRGFFSFMGTLPKSTDKDKWKNR